MSENACSLCLGLMLSLHAGSVLGQDTSTSSPFRVVGYLPDYRVEMIDPSVGRQLTDVVFFSVLPEPRGQFQSISREDSPLYRGLGSFEWICRDRVDTCVP